MTEFLNNLLLDKKKLLIAGILVFAMLYFDLTVFLKMQVGSIRQLNPKIVKLKSGLVIFQNDLQRMQEIKNKNAQPANKETKKNKKAISEDQIPALLEKISNLANKNSVLVAQIKPSREAAKVKQDKNAPPEKLSILLISMDLSAGYHNLGRFIGDLENDEVLMGLQSLKINPKKEDYLQQSVNLLIKAYVRK